MNVTSHTFGKYTLEDKVGEGGMGVVYKVTFADPAGEPQVMALKLLSVAEIATADDEEQFLQECKTLEGLEHPHVLEIHDYGVIDGIPFLATELCTDRSGQPMSLAQLACRHPEERIEPSALNVLFPQVLWALAFTHEQGVVHRDIKPENVLLQENELGQLRAKVGDFGLASVTVDPEHVRKPRWVDADAAAEDVAEDAAGVESDGAFSGTYDYMSPEQLAGEPLDSRADVYALGVMLYRLATGYDRVTFQKPSEIVEELPDWVDQVVMSAVVADQNQRCKNALELLFLLPETLRPGGVQRANWY